MKVRDVIERIKFATNTLATLNGRASNNLFSNKNICQQLKFGLDRYASKTLALEAIYSTQCNSDTASVLAPADALRSMVYEAITVNINGIQYMLNMAALQSSKTFYNYLVPLGIPQWIVPWEKLLYIFPVNSTTYKQTTLTSGITELSTTIPVGSTGGMVLYSGRITIGEEKISYGYSDSTNFYNCVRGVEGTVASAHLSGTTVLENNLQMNYYKRHFEIPVEINDSIPEDVLNLEMDVCDEHIEVICDYTTYKLLIKVDGPRAATYQDGYGGNFDLWMELARQYIAATRNEITGGMNITGRNYWQRPLGSQFLNS